MSEASLGVAMIDSETDKDEAFLIHKHALELSESPVGGMANGSVLADIGNCALNLGNTELAQRLFERALVHPSFFRIIFKPYNLLGLARIARQRRELDAAQDYINQARYIADTTSMLPVQAAVALEQGLLSAARGRPFCRGALVCRRRDARPIHEPPPACSSSAGRHRDESGRPGLDGSSRAGTLTGTRDSSKHRKFHFGCRITPHYLNARLAQIAKHFA